MAQSRKEIVAWVGSHVLPHERAVRAWLKRWSGHGQDVDDVIQEAYSRLAALNNVEHISNGRAYLFEAARNIVLEQARRSKVVRIDNVTDLAELAVADQAPLPERVVAGARELQRVKQLIDQLPSKCRRVFVLRRVHGVSQREIARELGISENTVEKHAVRGLRFILKALANDEERETSEGGAGDRSRQRTRNR